MVELAHTIGHVYGLHHRAERVDREPGDQKFRDVRELHVTTSPRPMPAPQAQREAPKFGGSRVAQRTVEAEKSGTVRGVIAAPLEPVAERFVTPPALGPEIGQGRIQSSRSYRSNVRQPIQIKGI